MRRYQKRQQAIAYEKNDLFLIVYTKYLYLSTTNAYLKGTLFFIGLGTRRLSYSSVLYCQAMMSPFFTWTLPQP